MARFYATITNGRGNATAVGGRSSVNSGHIRGWNAGVRIEPIGVKGEPDRFEVYMTTGSHARGHDVLLGTVHDTADGPQFILAGDEMSAEAMQTLAARNAPTNPNGTYRHPAHP